METMNLQFKQKSHKKGTGNIRFTRNIITNETLVNAVTEI